MKDLFNLFIELMRSEQKSESRGARANFRFVVLVAAVIVVVVGLPHLAQIFGSFELRLGDAVVLSGRGPSSSDLITVVVCVTALVLLVVFCLVMFVAVRDYQDPEP